MTTVAALKVVVTGDSSGLKGALNEGRTAVAALGNEAKEAVPPLGQAAAAYERLVQEQSEAAAKLKAESALLGATVAERQRAFAVLQAEHSLRRAGINLLSVEAKAYVANASSMAVARAEMEAQRKALLAAQAADATVLSAKGTALATHEVTNLSYQMNDVAMMLASGQSPFVVMMQQGMQVSQIFGQRGLGSIIPAIGTGLLSLISPTTLALAAITALGYGASYVFDAMGEDIVSADDALAGHEENIRRLKDAYGDAGSGLKTYAAESASVLAVLAAQSAEQLRVALRASASGAVDDMGSMTYSGFRANRDSIAFNDPIKALHQSALEGEPDIRRFREEVARIAESDKANSELQAMAAALLAATDEADRLSRALSASDAAIRNNGLSAKAAADNLSGYAKAMEALGKIGAPKQTERDLALSTFQDSMKNAQDIHERTAAINAYGAALARIRTGEIEETAKALEKLTSSQAEASEKLGIEQSMIGATAAERARALAVLQAEQALRRAGIDLSSAEAKAYVASAAAMAAKTAQMEREIALRDLSKSQAEDLAKAKAELALIGASSEARTRVIALLETERQIRAAGIDVKSKEADALRDQAEALAGLTTELERQQDAWSQVKGAGESAIDGFVSRLGSGDLTGALKGLGDDLMKLSLQMTVANPLKNFIFGSNHGTASDVVSGGLLGKLFGGGDKSADAVAAAAANALQSVAAMDVTAAVVNINGAGIGGLGSGQAGPLASVLSGNAVASNDNSNAGKIWNFFQAKGLKDFQISAIIGNLQAESGLDPSAVNPNGGASGLAQHLGSRLAGLKAFGGGALPGMDGQLSYIWKELQTSESPVLKRLLASTNLREATGAFAGFERAEGWTPKNPEGIALWDKRLAMASGTLDKFGGDASSTAYVDKFNSALDSASQTAKTATNALGGVSNSANDFAKTLSSIQAPGASIPFGNLFPNAALSPTLSAVLAGGGGGLFDSGGWTGDGHPSDVAGLVHGKEFVVRAGPAARHRPLLEAINENRLPGYAKGGWVGSAPAGASGVSGSGGEGTGQTQGATVNVQIIDNAGVTKRQERSRDGNGVDVMKIILDRVGSEMDSGGFDGPLSGRFGAQPMKVRR